MSEASNNQELAESHLSELIAQDPNDWETRKKLAQLLYNEGKVAQAAEVIWEAPEIPSIDLELGFAIKVLGKGAPSKAIRLLTGIQELNEGKAVQNLGLANALMHYGMVMQAARFYGAAMAIDPSLANPDLEHFLLWVDDKEKLWGDFEKDKPNLAELPWMKRDAKEAEALKKAMRGHTTPLKIPNLREVTAETVVHDMYVQSSRSGSDPTPPPAVSIPMDRVDPKHIVVDPERGAGEPVTAEQAQQAMGPIGGSSGQPLPPAPASPVQGAKALPPLNPPAPKPLMAPGLAKPLTPATPKPLTPGTAAPITPKPLTPGSVTPAATTPADIPASPPAPTPTGKLLTPGTPPTPKPLTPAAPKPLTPGTAAPISPKPLTPGSVTPAATTPADIPASPPAPAPTGKLLTPGTPPTPKPLTPASPIAAGAAKPLTPPAAPGTPDTPATPAAAKPLSPVTPASPPPLTPATPATPQPLTPAAATPPATSGAEQKPDAPQLQRNPQAAATQMSADGKIIPNPIATQRLGDTPAPVLRPIQPTTLVDGKIVINRPAAQPLEKDNKDQNS